jgi:hypothetical protein
MPSHDDREITEALAALPPAPAAWVAKAKALPEARRGSKGGRGMKGGRGPKGGGGAAASRGLVVKLSAFRGRGGTG